MHSYWCKYKHAHTCILHNIYDTFSRNGVPIPKFSVTSLKYISCSSSFFIHSKGPHQYSTPSFAFQPFPSQYHVSLEFPSSLPFPFIKLNNHLENPFQLLAPSKVFSYCKPACRHGVGFATPNKLCHT